VSLDRRDRREHPQLAAIRTAVLCRHEYDQAYGMPADHRRARSREATDSAELPPGIRRNDPRSRPRARHRGCRPTALAHRGRLAELPGVSPFFRCSLRSLWPCDRRDSRPLPPPNVKNARSSETGWSANRAVTPRDAGLLTQPNRSRQRSSHDRPIGFDQAHWGMAWIFRGLVGSSAGCSSAHS
jgi:hypothetical protein